MIKAIIFDYDGVIVDSFSKVHEVYQTICKKLGKTCPKNFEEFKKIYGYSSRELVKNLGFSEEETKKANSLYKTEILKQDSELFEGIKEVFDELKKSYNLVLISSSPRVEVMKKLEKYKISKKFDLIFASDESAPMRKINAIKETLRQLGVKPFEVIMIGDRTIDYDEGIEAGLESDKIILVEYGWGYDKDKVPKQKILVEKPLDLLKAIKNIN